MKSIEEEHNWAYLRPTNEAACMGAIERSYGTQQRPDGPRYVEGFAYEGGSKTFGRTDKSGSE